MGRRAGDCESQQRSKRHVLEQQPLYCHTPIALSGSISLNAWREELYC